MDEYGLEDGGAQKIGGAVPEDLKSCGIELTGKRLQVISMYQDRMRPGIGCTAFDVLIRPSLRAIT
jgi:hypothetical protein